MKKRGGGLVGGVPGIRVSGGAEDNAGEVGDEGCWDEAGEGEGEDGDDKAADEAVCFRRGVVAKVAKSSSPGCCLEEGEGSSVWAEESVVVVVAWSLVLLTRWS